MNYSADYDQFGQHDLFVADATQAERVSFIRRTYAHVAGAVALTVLLVGVAINTPSIVQPMLGLMQQGWWMVLIAYMAASFAAQRMAESRANPGLQYFGLGLYCLAISVLFTPFIYFVQVTKGNDLILQAAVITLTIFGGLTMFVMFTKSDFSFLRNFLVIGSLAAVALVFVSFIAPISLGTWFSAAMILLFCGFILWDTSNVLHHYQTDQHVAASLAIFASLATLFWYVLRFTAAFDD